MIFSFGRKRTWHMSDKGVIYCRFWGISFGDTHIGVQHWWVEGVT